MVTDRAGARSAASEVLVSGRVQDLVAGSGTEFGDRGEHELKGCLGPETVCPGQNGPLMLQDARKWIGREVLYGSVFSSDAPLLVGRVSKIGQPISVIHAASSSVSWGPTT